MPLPLRPRSRPVRPLTDTELRAERLADHLDRPVTIAGILFVLVVVADTATDPASPWSTVWSVTTWVLWGLFVAEFAARLVVARDTWRFLRRNWWQVLFLAVPFLRFLRAWSRTARLARVGSSSVRSSRTAASKLRSRARWLAALTATVMLLGANLLFELGHAPTLPESLYQATLAALAGEPLDGPTGWARLVEIALIAWSAIGFAALAGSAGAFFLETFTEEAANRRADRADGYVGPMTNPGDGIAYTNGTYVPLAEASVPLLDPGFTRGDAVYDTTSVWNGSFFRLDDHVERFFRSCQRARLSPPVGPDELKAVLASCVDRTGLPSAFVQMISTRGRYRNPLVRDPRQCDNTLYAYALPYIWIVAPDRQLEGIDLVVATGNRRTPPEAIDPRMKNFNWLDLQKGLFEALDRGGETAVLSTPDGRLSEGPGFNVFVVRDGAVLTPRGNVLEGITRRTVFELADGLDLTVTEADLTADDLHRADEAFLSSTAGGIMPVATVDGRPLGHGPGAGPVSLRLRAEYWARREAGWHATPVADLLPR